MAHTDLKNIKIGVSPLTGGIYIYRHGKDPGLALDKRPAEADVLKAAVEHVLWGMEENAAVMLECKIGEQKYRITVERE